MRNYRPVGRAIPSALYLKSGSEQERRETLTILDIQHWFSGLRPREASDVRLCYSYPASTERPQVLRVSRTRPILTKFRRILKLFILKIANVRHPLGLRPQFASDSAMLALAGRRTETSVRAIRSYSLYYFPNERTFQSQKDAMYKDHCVL